MEEPRCWILRVSVWSKLPVIGLPFWLVSTFFGSKLAETDPKSEAALMGKATEPFGEEESCLLSRFWTGARRGGPNGRWLRPRSKQAGILFWSSAFGTGQIGVYFLLCQLDLRKGTSVLPVLLLEKVVSFVSGS